MKPSFRMALVPLSIAAMLSGCSHPPPPEPMRAVRTAEISEVRNRVAVLIGGCREITGALGQCRHPEPVDLPATLPRPVFVTVEEEQLVAASGLPHRSAQ